MHRVRIHFDAWAARLVRERLWHESQMLRDLESGELELQMELSGLEEIERWVLSWGAHARILAPKKLREMIQATARQIAAY
jgi:proteasome accessory factor B